jgi:hypothetical protein
MNIDIYINARAGRNRVDSSELTELDVQTAHT